MYTYIYKCNMWFEIFTNLGGAKINQRLETRILSWKKINIAIIDVWCFLMEFFIQAGLGRS